MRYLFLSIFISLLGLVAHAQSTLELINLSVYRTGHVFDGLEMGGLSGLSYEPQSKTLWAVSDDRAQRGKARIYNFELSSNKGAWDARPTGWRELSAPNGRSYSAGEVDFESVALFKDGLLISSEGDLGRNLPLPASLTRFAVSGAHAQDLILPSTITGAVSGQGPWPNRAFEALSVAPDGEHIFFAPEGGYRQDTQSNNPMNGGNLRLHKAIMQKGELKILAEYVYPLELVEGGRGDNGLVELVALSETSLLALERGYSGQNNKNTIRLFKIDLNGAQDVSGLASLKDQRFVPISKQLIADLDSFLPRFPLEERRLDNMEGLTLGPVLPDGGRLLVMVSDNNFSPLQRTMFLFFNFRDNATKAAP